MNDRIKNSYGQWRGALLAALLITAGSSLAYSKLADAKSDTKPASVHLTVDQTSVDRDGKFVTSFAPVVKKVAPSVVKVFTTSQPKASARPDWQFRNDPFFRRFFGDPSDGEGQGQRRNFKLPKQHGLGSGVVVSKDGYILTNNHVVDGADQIKVALTDGREFDAKLIGTDPKTEIAVLKIDASDLPFMTLADSEKIEVGDLVLAIGNPFGIGQTVTMGMVSAVGRASMGLDYEDFIQTDAAINPGNSGGALVDANGRLIGINTLIISRSGGNEGIGFAVPINLARNVMESLVEHGRVVRGFLGVNIQDVTPNLAKEFNIDNGKGALVAEVTPDSPAEKAGIKSGDVITEFNGKPVRDSRTLKLQVGQLNPGQKVALTVVRDGKTKDLHVTLKELSEKELASNSKGKSSSHSETLEGVTVGDIDSAARSQMKLPRQIQGALVTAVDEDSAAFESGLREGDVIQEINRQPVHDAGEAVALSEKAHSGKTLLRVWSKGVSRYMVVDQSKVG